MKFKSTIKTAFTAVAVAAALAACGGGGGGGGAADVAAGAAAVGTTPIAQAIIAGALAGTTTVGSTVSVTGKLTLTGGVTSLFQVPLTLSGVYGTFTMNTTGDWTYVLDPVKAYAIAADSIVKDALLVKSSDGVASSTVTVSVQGLLSTNSSLVTSVPAPTYPAGSEELAAFNLLNAERGRCGFGLVAQNAAIDKAAKAHADYQAINFALDHYEIVTLVGFTGISPFDRMLDAGYLNGSYIGADEIMSSSASHGDKVGLGAYSVRGLLNAPYHMDGMLGAARDIGISLQSTLYFRKTIPAFVYAQFNTSSTITAGPQLQASSAVNTYPCEGTSGTDYQLKNEEPNPVPGRDLALNPLGSSVLVAVREGNALLITSYSMTQVTNGTKVTLRPPVNHGPTNRYFITADAPTLPNTAYKVTVSGTNNGEGFTTAFTFTTGTGG